ncbi:MAG TPA: type I phosphomannose isomerase catalytic subunit [Bacillota bacterium]|nr:type I phosphomannose isomerase catalytic subunit [Bacillota bacterium]
MYPLKFQPIYKDYLWGGRNLVQLGKVLPPEGIVAESWEVSGHPEGLSMVTNGEYAGTNLCDLINQYPQEILGTAVHLKYGQKFPLLVKLIDANQKLSVQVHPDDAYALNKENEFGKHEIWYIISAHPGARIIYGFAPRITQEDFARRIEAADVESALQYLEVAPGDVIDIPPGVVHALGEGIVLAEIQQNSNATYRVYDYDRVDATGQKRPLHVEKALQVIDFTPEKRGKVVCGVPEKLSDMSVKTPLTTNFHFAVDHYQINDPVSETAAGDRFYIYTVLEGEGSIRWQDTELPVRRGESVLIPALLGTYQLTGKWQALKSYATAKLKTRGM